MVWLQTTREEAQRHIPLSRGHFAEANQGVLIRCEVDDLLWVARLLAGLGMPFVIHHPPELRTAFRHYAREMMSYAERDAPLAKALTRSLVLGGLAAVEHSGWLR